jgi:DNA-directed RNA polymerase sigma subunit (sigma70/sigma32)
MEHPLIHDRGRGPELLDRRITIYNLVPFFLRAEYTEARIAESFLISVEQVAAMRAYFLDRYADVMAEHEKIEERLRKSYEAQDTPEFRAKWAKTRAAFEQYKIWLREGGPETKLPDREARAAAFRFWYDARTKSLMESIA